MDIIKFGYVIGILVWLLITFFYGIFELITNDGKLRDVKTDNNLLLLKTEMNAGHGGKSGRDGAIEEIALDYAFVLKITKKI